MIKISHVKEVTRLQSLPQEVVVIVGKLHPYLTMSMEWTEMSMEMRA